MEQGEKMGRAHVLTVEQRQEVIQTVDRRLRDLGVTGLREVLKEQTEQLGQAITRLAEAQARTDASLQKLAQAQARTEARVEELAQAQARTEARVEELAQAQARTEARVDRVEAALERLAQAQARTEAAVKELAEAQRRTEMALKEQQRHLSGLGEVIGFGLEDIARTVVPGYLQRHFGIDLEGPLGEELNPEFFQTGSGQVEIDLYGQGFRNGQRIVVLGESKSRIGRSEVLHFADKLVLVEPLVEGEIWRVMFGYYIHPSAREAAAEHQIYLIASYQR